MKLIGIGQAMRGDDAAGIEALWLLQQHFPDIQGEALTGEPTMLLNAFAGADHVVLLDCILAAPGDTEPRVIDGLSENLPRESGASTHNFSIREAIELGRVLGRLPNRLTILGIPGHDFALGANLSADTVTALARLVDFFPQWRQEHA